MGSVFVSSTNTDSIVQLSARGEVVKAHNVGMRVPYAIRVSNDGRYLVLANCLNDKEPITKLFRVNY